MSERSGQPITFTPDAPYSYDPRGKDSIVITLDELKEAYAHEAACHHPTPHSSFDDLLQQPLPEQLKTLPNTIGHVSIEAFLNEN